MCGSLKRRARALEAISALLSDFWKMFGLSMVVFLCKIACRLIIRVKVLGNKAATSKRRLRAVAESIRVGFDLCFISLVAFAGLARTIMKNARNPNVPSALDYHGETMFFTLFLLLLTLLFMALWDSKHVVKGLVVPNVIGVLSLYITVQFLRTLIAGLG